MITTLSTTTVAVNADYNPKPKEEKKAEHVVPSCSIPLFAIFQNQMDTTTIVEFEKSNQLGDLVDSFLAKKLILVHLKIGYPICQS